MRRLERLSIKKQFLVALFFFVAAILAIVFLMYRQATDVILEKNKAYAQDILSQTRQVIVSNTNEIGRVLITLSIDPSIQKYMMMTDESAAYKVSKEIISKLSSYKYSIAGIYDIVVIGGHGVKCNLGDGLILAGKLEKDIEANGSGYVSGFLPLDEENGASCVVFAQNVYSSDINNGHIGERIGSIAVIADANTLLFDADSSSKKDISFYILDKDRKIYPPIDSAELSAGIVSAATALTHGAQQTVKIGGVTGIARLDGLEPLSFTMLSFVTESQLLRELSTVQTRTIVILMVTLLVLCLPFLFIINNIIAPLQKLIEFTRCIKGGKLMNLQAKVKLEGNSEMAEVGDELNLMLEEINRLTNKLVETTSHLYLAELENEKAASAFLRSQINPHFLYNTLESIKGLAIRHGSPQIVDMAKSLGKLFQYSVKGTNDVTLEQELNAVKDYIKLQLIRFDERFRVEYRFPDAALRLRVIKMVLQPLVENAITHGLEPIEENGLLCLGAEITVSGDLMIWVKDNGMGIDGDTLAALQRQLDEKLTALRGDELFSGGNASIGLANVNRRIKLVYGAQYGLSLESAPGQGTSAILKMPVQSWEQEACNV